MAQSIIPVTGSAHSASAFDDLFEALALHGDADLQGVVRGKLNELVTTGVASPITTASGWAWVNGKLYQNTANVNTAVATPAAATRVDRLVVRVDYTAGPPETGVLTLRQGVEGAGVPPALVQIDGTTWDLPLYQVAITVGGVITLSPQWFYAGARTRRFLVQAEGMYETVALESQYKPRVAANGWRLTDNVLRAVVGSFYCPEDYASGMVVEAIVLADASGNMYRQGSFRYATAGEDWDTHTDTLAAMTEAVVADQITNVGATTLDNIAPLDVVSCWFERNAAHANDTVNADCYFFGWRVSYTADS